MPSAAHAHFNQPPAPWAAVLAQILDYEDAVALMRLFEDAVSLMRWFDRRFVLCADDSPIFELDIGVSNQSDIALATFLAAHLNRTLGDTGWSYDHLYAATRDTHPSEADVQSFITRCLDAGVNLHHRPR